MTDTTRYARGEWLFYDGNPPVQGESDSGTYRYNPAPVEVLLDDGERGVWIIPADAAPSKARLVSREYLRPRIELGVYRYRHGFGSPAGYRVTNVVRMTAGFFVIFELVSNPEWTYHAHIDKFARDYERVEDSDASM